MPEIALIRNINWNNVPVSALVSPMVCFMTTVPIRVVDASEHKSPSATLVVCLTASQLPHLLQVQFFWVSV